MFGVVKRIMRTSIDVVVLESKAKKWKEFSGFVQLCV